MTNGRENDFNFKCDFEVDLFRILVDFGAILRPKIAPKCKKNELKKRCDFKTNLEDRPGGNDSTSLGRPGSLAASRTSRPIGLKQYMG